MRWLKEHGLIGSYDDYVGLPLPVLADARLGMAAEAEDYQRKEQERKAKEAQRGVRR